MTFEPRLKFWVSTLSIVCVSPQMHWSKEPSATCYSRRKNITVLVARAHDIFRECVMSSLQLWDLKEHKRWSLGHLRNLEVLKWGEPRKKLSQRSSFLVVVLPLGVWHISLQSGYCIWPLTESSLLLTNYKDEGFNCHSLGLSSEARQKEEYQRIYVVDVFSVSQHCRETLSGFKISTAAACEVLLLP